LLVKKEKAPAIWVYEDCFNPKNFIDLIEEEASKDWPYLSWTSSSTGGKDASVTSEYRTSQEMFVSPLLSDKVDESLKDISSLFFNIFSDIDKTVWDYRECFDLYLNSHEGLGLLKYSHGGEYHHHYDHAPDNARVLSLVASMSSDCEGGELEFPHFGTKLKLQTGSVVLFPSNFPYMHIAHPVTSGTKYSMVTWFV
jgi:hypothetical protein